MTIDQQRELIKTYEQYQNTDHKTIKINLKSIMIDKDIKPSELSQLTNIPIQTIYQYRKLQYHLKPSFIDLICICNALNTSIDEVLQPVRYEYPPQVWTNPKWTDKSKLEFCIEFQNSRVTATAKSYGITVRTAQEYYRIFSDELKISR